MIRVISIIVLLSFFFSTTAAPALAAMTYLYDTNGNMTSDGTKCYEYNDANQLKKVKKCSDSKIIAEYIYDHTGKRIIKKEYKNGVLDRTVYSIGDEYETVVLASNGAKLNTTYYKVNDEVVAKKNPDGTLNYYHNDHLGSNSVLTNQSGAVVEKTTYAPYGEVKSGGAKSKFGYTGQEKDQETGLNYYDSRYYDPHLQRFVQPDTMLPDVYDPQQLNRYSYAVNNPLKYTDPSGHCVWIFTPFCGAITSFLTRIAQPVINFVTKTQNNPVVQKIEQNVAKTQSNPIVQKAETVAGRMGNNPVVQKTTSNVEKITKTAGSVKTQINIGEHIQKDISKRGWTEDLIQETVNNPTKTVITRDVRHIKGGGGVRIDDPATGYIAEDGSYVVVNNITKDVVQISDKFKPWGAPWDK